MRIIEHDGRHCVVLKVWPAPNDGAEDGYDCALVPIDAAYLARLIGLIEHVAELHTADHQVAYLQRWDYALDYWPVDWDDEANTDEHLTPDLAGEPGRIELAVACLGYEDLHWEARVKNGDTQLDTESLTLTELRELLASCAPEVTT